jgi:hypothetical protein
MRHWLKFSIRDLLWAMVVLALGCGWWMQSNRAAVQAEQQRASLQREITDVFRELVTLERAVGMAGFRLEHEGDLPHLVRTYPRENEPL